MLRVIVLGYGEMAASLMLGVLESGHNLVGYMPWEFNSNPNIIKKLFPFFFHDDLSTIAKKYKIHKIKASLTKDVAFKKEIKRLKPDVILVGSWGEILKEDVIKLPKIATINCHPSLLPRYRGANPYAAVLKADEKVSGITFHLVDKGIDTGAILLQKSVDINDDDTGETLRIKCSYRSKETIGGLLDDLENDIIIPLIQDESKSSYHKRLNLYDTSIDWNTSARSIHNRIRAITPWLYGYAEHGENILMLRKTKIVDVQANSRKPGTIIQKGNNFIVVATADNDKAVMFSQVGLYGKSKRFFSPIYFKFVIKEGDILKKL
ncbi:MAG: methionyl-tRNA formyltransferase [bacterium]